MNKQIETDNLNRKNYEILVEFSNFLRQNGDKLCEKDSKLSLKTEQLLVLQDYLEQIVLKTSSSNDLTDQKTKRNKVNTNLSNSKEFLKLYKSNQLHLIQDFLFKITNLKITAEKPLIPFQEYIKLNTFSSLVYLELKNCNINNVTDIQNLRIQLEVLICTKSLKKIQDLLHLCGADQSSPLTWPKLSTLGLSHNQLISLDSTLNLALSIVNLDLSHNNLTNCEEFLHCLKNLRKLNLSFNKLVSVPSLSETTSLCEYMDLSYNNIEILNTNNLSKLLCLTYLNLSSNLINSINELDNLRLLDSIKYILVDHNPIKNNEYCDSTIKEIVDLVALKVKVKRTSLGASQINSWSPGKRSMVTKSVSINKPTLTKDTSNLTPIQSASSRKIKQATQRQDSIVKRKLKANNIMINEQETSESENDYVLLSIDNSSFRYNEISTLELASKMSVSIGTDYESNKLQIEIENLKRMRQNYGTDWLLSTPNLMINPVLKLKSDIQGDSKLVESSDETNVQQEENSFNKSDESIKNLIDSFLVYKSLDYSGDMLNNNQISQNKKLCILSLNENCLIEKDETNSEILNISDHSSLFDIKIHEERDKYFIIKFKYIQTKTIRIYEFQNQPELYLFIECLRNTLFREINLKQCELYFCIWCAEFNKKSKFKLDDEINEQINNEFINEQTQNEFENFTCTKCSRYLIKERIIQNKDEKANESDNEAKTNFNFEQSLPKESFIQSVNFTTSELEKQSEESISQMSTSLGPNFTLKDVLKSFNTKEKREKTMSETTNDSESNNLSLNEKINRESESIQFKIENENIDSLPASSSSSLNNVSSTADILNSMNVVSSKSPTTSQTETDQIYLIENSSSEKKPLSLNERLKCLFSKSQITKAKLDEISNESKRINNNLKLFLLINVISESSDNENEEANFKEEETLLCIFKLKYAFSNLRNKSNENGQKTSKKLNCIQNCLCVFTNKKIVLFKVLDIELFNKSIDLDKCLNKELSFEINKIEILEVGFGQNCLIVESTFGNNNENSPNAYFKFITCDSCQNQALLSTFLKTIDQSKNLTMFKQLRKRNEQTYTNLSKILSVFDSGLDTSTLSINLIGYIDELKINKNETSSETFEYSIQEILLYNNEFILLIEENLSYYNDVNNKVKQFKLIDNAKISDIVDLKLFEDSDAAIELAIVDESRNSNQISWLFNLHEQYLLSQLISQIKQTWEEIFGIEIKIELVKRD